MSGVWQAAWQAGRAYTLAAVRARQTAREYAEAVRSREDREQ